MRVLVVDRGEPGSPGSDGASPYRRRWRPADHADPPTRRPADTPTRFPYPPIENPFFRAVCRKRLRNFVSMNAKAAGRPSDW